MPPRAPSDTSALPAGAESNGTGSEPHIDPQRFRTVMGQFATGVTVITAIDGTRVHGMTASAFLSGSLEPPLCVVSIGRDTRMHESLKRVDRFGVSILAHDQMHIAVHFAGRPDPDLKPDFETIAGVPLIEHATAHMVAALADTHTAGDHSLIVGRLIFMDCDEARAPLLHHGGRFGSLILRPDDRGTSVPEFW